MRIFGFEIFQHSRLKKQDLRPMYEWHATKEAYYCKNAKDLADGGESGET